jgi:hypothetical protein
MKDECDKLDEVDDLKDKAIIKQLEVDGFFKRLRPYNKPTINVVLGVLVSII